jgi:hypothetical protein
MHVNNKFQNIRLRFECALVHAVCMKKDSLVFVGHIRYSLLKTQMSPYKKF